MTLEEHIKQRILDEARRKSNSSTLGLLWKGIKATARGVSKVAGAVTGSTKKKEESEAFEAGHKQGYSRPRSQPKPPYHFLHPNNKHMLNAFHAGHDAGQTLYHTGANP